MDEASIISLWNWGKKKEWNLLTNLYCCANVLSCEVYKLIVNGIRKLAFLLSCNLVFSFNGNVINFDA